jgi:glucans biosynthesis protein
VLQTSTGEVTDVQLLPLPDDAGWRVSFRLAPDGDRGADMRLWLARDGRAVSETWSYLWDPAGNR